VQANVYHTACFLGISHYKANLLSSSDGGPPKPQYPDFLSESHQRQPGKHLSAIHLFHRSTSQGLNTDALLDAGSFAVS